MPDSYWNDDGCSYQKGYICHSVVAPQQTMVKDAFMVHQFHRDEVHAAVEGYDNAEAACRARGRALASIHNAEQQAAALKLLDDSNMESALIGLHDRSCVPSDCPDNLI